MSGSPVAPTLAGLGIRATLAHGELVAVLALLEGADDYAFGEELNEVLKERLSVAARLLKMSYREMAEFCQRFLRLERPQRTALIRGLRSELLPKRPNTS